MKTAKDLLLDYGFENIVDLETTLKEGERTGENSLFFQNAMQLIRDMFELDKEKEKQVKNAYKLGGLVKLRQHKDAQFTEFAEKMKKPIEEKMGDIIEESPELEEFIPNPITWR